MAEAAGRLERAQQVIPRHRIYLYSVLSLIGPVTRSRCCWSPAPLPSRSWAVVPLATSIVTSVLLIARLSQLVRFANRRVEDLDAHALALGEALREQEALQQQLTHRALHDALTGLANRALLRERLEHAADARRPTPAHGLLLLDLDGFKDVNDTLGHPVGDALLVEVGRPAASASVRPATRWSALGGDEFAVLLRGRAGDAGDRASARRSLDALGQPYADRRRGSCASRPASASLLAHAPASRADGCCATPTSRCTRPRRPARTARRLRARAGQRARTSSMRLTPDLRARRRDDELAVHYQPVGRPGHRPGRRGRGAAALAAPRRRGRCRRWTSSRSPSRPA